MPELEGVEEGGGVDEEVVGDVVVAEDVVVVGVLEGEGGIIE